MLAAETLDGGRERVWKIGKRLSLARNDSIWFSNYWSSWLLATRFEERKNGPNWGPLIPDQH